MIQKIIERADYLFEVSWEVCNKVGGIHTVIATKAHNLSKVYGENHILIGPDVWMETKKNPEFSEDRALFHSWSKKAVNEGIRVRIGRWNVAGNPIAILVDFSSFITRKDEIFAKLWEDFKLDSISGQWDYVEPTLFGFAAGKVIESFVNFYMQPHHKVVAQFHEWMSAAGLLYIKKQNLAVGTVFTTHATVVGRCLACNNMPLYDSINLYDADEKARQFNVVAKHSLEKTAAQNADVFTTVSNITANECWLFLKRKPDFITPNGFDGIIAPAEGEYDKARSEARRLMLHVASNMYNIDYKEDTVIVGISGRYEYKNKGIDVFLDAVDKIKNEGWKGRKILAFVMIPAGNNGPDKDLAAKLEGKGSRDYKTYITHYLSNGGHDAILNRIRSFNFDPSKDDVSVAYVPTYLNGNDGIFNKSYYDILPGMDLTVFPSYYEPWGYTPLESLAFRVPTITTSLSGFGAWVSDNYKKEHPGIAILQRSDSNYNQVVDGTVAKIKEIANLNAAQEKDYKANAKDVSSVSLWDNVIVYYKQAYVKALEEVVKRNGAFPELAEEPEQEVKKFQVEPPQWKQLMIKKSLPDRLKGLDELSKNLWWCWNQEAIELFQIADPALWKKSEENPIAMLDMMDLKKYRELVANEEFTGKLDSVVEHFHQYMSLKKDESAPRIAYFCMEYGLDTSLKIYSGGLGILAGDYLKETSDMNVNMNAIGFLYKYGYFTQKISAGGDQIALYDPQDFSMTPAQPVMDNNGKWQKISVAFPGRNIYARIWQVRVGRINLFLLDSDIEDNLPEDRGVTGQLYGGDWENRLKQELLLGIGGIRALRLLGIYADVYHCNEGHAAFTGLERLREYIQNDNLSFSEALEVVRSSSLFTTHTPVPAGHDAFSEDMMRTYLSHDPEHLKISWNDIMRLGKLDVNNHDEKFSMSNLAANLSQEVNGVSRLHGKVSREIFSKLWPGYLPEELHIGYVTNGVHYSTWTAPEWKEIHAKVFGKDFSSHHYDRSCFQGFRNVPDDTIWSVRKKLKKKLLEKVKEILSESGTANPYAPHDIVKINSTLNDKILTIGFARRFATYKRAHLLFTDLKRLDQIINNPSRPVQFLFAGKAHPADKEGQDLIKRIVEVSKMPQFIGKIIFIPNYDISLAKYLVQGVDIWMNTPTRPLEASGTSGEKAVMNGVMHFSVLDGWWVEGYKEGAGWALKMERSYNDRGFQDELDAATLYNILETDIVPRYYDVDKRGISTAWIDTIKNCVAEVACNFTTNRMVEDYLRQYYIPLCTRKHMLIEKDFAIAKEIASWKRRMRREWPDIELVSQARIDTSSGVLLLGKEYKAKIVLQLGEVSPDDLGLELLLTEKSTSDVPDGPKSGGELAIKGVFPYKLENFDAGRATYVCNLIPEETGTYLMASRLYAYNKLMPHRQDFELVKWL
ncbi:MAG: alpha-glucan family phosphorylase [Bacteroidales bacterium]|nr:alpha-glucan family phosphorylase [Bacteroidales bacterium]